MVVYMRLILMIAVLILSLRVMAIANPTVIQFFPARPADSHVLSITKGIFMQYHLYTEHNTLQALITLRDEVTGLDRSYYLSGNVVLNGATLRCPNSANEHSNHDAANVFVDELALCRSLPANIIAGKTRLVLLYWPFNDRLAGGAAYATDQILSLP